MYLNDTAGDQWQEIECESCIGWRNLRFETQEWFGKEKKVILNRLNGCFEYHTLNAFMGPSGAGKTTLLDCLSGNRIGGLTKDSEIFLNKNQKDGDKVVSYFIEQHVQKTMVGGMRVRQILRYAYRFKNGGEGDMERHIGKIIDELLLDEKVLDRKFEQCSGGEQKRIAIAQELMSLRKPTLLFVDEPTTGLDSNAAHLVMQCLKQLATNHRMTVVTSIHVPSDDILNLFDKLYVLAKGGVCIYSGPPDQIRSYLQFDFDQSPIEHLTKIACAGITDSHVVTLANQTLTAEYQNVSQRLPKLVHYPNGIPNDRKPFQISHLFVQTCRMFRITFITSYKLILFQLLAGIYYLAFSTSLFTTEMVKPSGCYPISLNDTEQNNSTCTDQIENDSQIRRSILFHGGTVNYNAFVLICMAAFLFGPIVKVFQNEHRNQWYSLGVFFWSGTLVGIVQVTLYSIGYALFGYLYSGQHYIDNYTINWHRFSHYLHFLEIEAIYLESLGQLIGSILLTNVEFSMVIVTLFTVIITIFSGSMMDLEFSNNFLILLIKDVVQINSIFKGIVYTFYGLDRCQSDREYSLVMINYHVDQDDLPKYTQPVLINTVVIRLVTVAYLCWRFNRFGSKQSQRTNVSSNYCEPKEIILIEYASMANNAAVMNQETIELDCYKISITKINKTKDEDDFEKFSRKKILIAWRNLSLFGTSFLFEQTICDRNNDASANEKCILKNLNGEFRFGTLNALMGTSGAGKTSLLKVLNGRDKTRLSAASQFYLSKFTRIQTCFITQDVSEHLLPGLTAKQTLVYASRLKNAQLVDTSQIDHQQIALNLLDELDMSDTADTLVEKCSGGERKRLALAAELTALQMPNLICIDEPTSGLDSNSAEVVVACLHKLTQIHSITIVASIHQPNTELLRMFDQIYVLARGGVCIYSGAPDSIYTQLCTVSDIPPIDSKFPIEALIKHSCSSYQDPIVQQLMSQNDHQFSQSIVDSGLLTDETLLVVDGIPQNRRRFSLDDTWILCARYLAYVRGHLWIQWIAYLVIYLGYGIFMINLFDSSIGTVSGCLNLDDDFNNTCTKTEEKIVDENLLTYNLQFISFAFCFFQIFVMIQSGLSFFSESVYFFNEHRNGWYSSGSFYLTKSLFGSIPLICVILAYVWLCDIYEPILPGLYYHLVLVMCLATLANQGLSHLISLISFGHILILAILGCCVFLTNFFITNYFIPVNSRHYLFQSIAKFSFVGYTLDSIVILQYGFDRCLPKQIPTLLYLFSLDDSDYGPNLIALVLLAVMFHLISIGVLVCLVNPAENRRRNIERVTNYCEKLRPTNTILPGIGSPNEFRIRLIRF